MIIKLQKSIATVFVIAGAVSGSTAYVNDSANSENHFTGDYAIVSGE